MMFLFDLYKTPLLFAVELNEVEIVRLLLENTKIDVNKRSILKTFFLLYFKLINLIKFKIKYFNEVTN